MKRFQSVGLKTALLKLCVSINAGMKMFERKLLFVLIAVPWFFLLIMLSIKLERTERTFGPKKETFSFFTFVFSIRFIKSVASLRCGFCDYDIGCSNVPVLTKEDVFSVRPSDES